MITPAELVDAVRVSQPCVTPDGATVLYVVHRPEGDGETGEVWECGIDGAAPRRVAEDVGGVESISLAPGGDRVAIVAGGDDVSRLLVHSRVGGAAREVFRHSTAMPGPVASGSNGIRDVAWSPDGRSIAYVAYVVGNGADRPVYVETAPHVRVIRSPMYKEDGLGAAPTGTLQIHLVDIETGAAQRISTTAHDHGRPLFSPEGRWIAAQRRDPTDNYRSKVVLYATDDSGDPVAIGPVAIGMEHGRLDHFAWSPDGTRLALIGSTRVPPSPCRELLVYDLRSGELAEVLADAPGEQPLDAPVWLDDATLLVHGLGGATSALFRVDVASATSTIVGNLAGGHSGTAVDRDRRVLVQVRETPTSFGEVVAVDVATGAWRTVAETSGDLVRRADVSPVSRLGVPSEGFTIDVAMLRPSTAEPGEPLPTVFALHGGPADAWGGFFTDIAFLLASNGYQVAMPNVRGSIGYGRDFAEAEQADYGGGEFRDLMAVVDAVSASEGADPDRLGIVGGSHGGYLTAWAISHSDRFAAAVCVCPVFDLRSLWGTHDVGPGWGDLYHGGPPWERPDVYDGRSASSHAHRITTPTLVVHGEEDHRCSVGQGEQLFAILHRTGCPTELVLYPGASHGFGEPDFPRRTRTDYFERLLGWFDRHLRASG